MKSNVSNHLELAHNIYLDACAKCPAEVSDLRDLDTIRSRAEKEGLSFLTITLPDFCKDFERSLADGHIAPSRFRSFRKRGAIPAFLQGMLGRIFSVETGRINEQDQETPLLVEAVRQICLFFKKVEVPCTPERERAAISNYVLVEQLNRDFQVPEKLRADFARVSSSLWSGMLHDIRVSMLSPRHGPGATAERISGNGKYIPRRWHDRLEPFFPLIDCAIPIGAVSEMGSGGPDETGSLAKMLKMVTIVPEADEQPVRVITVPKTLKSPRIIAIEPVCMQYTQQAIQAVLYERLESYWLTKGHVNFRDQSVNQRLALMSSKDGRLATIDLSDASDRVLHDLAMTMFDSNPDLRDAIDACRSKMAKLPDGTLVGPLRKFASMGSALCFPIEAMYFYTICVLALLRSRNLPVSLFNINSVKEDLYVYGDDIIVPSTEAGIVLDHLHEYHCKVNSSKSFWTGKFRESCGTDAYDGIRVTPIYLRRERPKNKRDARSLLSWIATANLLDQRGYGRTASFMYSTCERILGSLPHVSPESSALGRLSHRSYDLGYSNPSPRLTRVNRRLQRREIYAWVPSVVYRCDEIDGYPALQKSLMALEGRLPPPLFEHRDFSVMEARCKGILPLPSDQHHLGRSARRGAVTLKRRWVPLT